MKPELTAAGGLGSLALQSKIRDGVMTLRISLDLTDRDLRFFRDAVKKSRHAVRDADEEEIIDAISSVIVDIRKEDPLPDFINRRLPDLEAMTNMLRDDEWRLPFADRERVLATFVYFGDPEDLIPDNIPGIGYLDDVIMIELLLREMRHVRDAYRDFCAFRDEYDQRHAGDDAAKTREQRLAARRRQLHQRMKRRTASDRKLQGTAALF